MEQYVIQPAGDAESEAVHAGLRAYNRKFVPDTGDLSLAVKDAALLSLMAREKIIPQGDVAGLLEKAQEGDSVEVLSARWKVAMAYTMDSYKNRYQIERVKDN